MFPIVQAIAILVLGGIMGPTGTPGATYNPNAPYLTTGAIGMQGYSSGSSPNVSTFMGSGNIPAPTVAGPQSFNPQQSAAIQTPAPSAPTGSPAPSNNSSSLSLRQQMEQGLIPWDDNKLNAGSGTPSMDMGAITSAYDQMRATLEGMRPQYEAAYGQAQTEAGNTLANQKQQLSDSQSQMENLNRSAQGTLYQNLLSDTAHNRGIARAMGGYGSGFEQGNTKIQQGYGANTASMQNDLGNRLAQLKLAGVQAEQDHASALAKAKNDYMAGLNQIALNENSTDLQKAQSLQAAQADFNNKVYQSNQALQAFQQQKELMKMQTEAYSKMYGGAITNYNPVSTAASSGYNFGAANPTAQSTYGFGTDTKKAIPGINPAISAIYNGQL